MNNGILIFLGVILTVLWSWYGFIAQNVRELSKLEPAKLITGETFPTGRSGTANLGQEVYQANGCARISPVSRTPAHVSRSLMRLLPILCS